MSVFCGCCVMPFLLFLGCHVCLLSFWFRWLFVGIVEVLFGVFCLFVGCLWLLPLSVLALCLFVAVIVLCCLLVLFVGA